MLWIEPLTGNVVTESLGFLLCVAISELKRGLVVPVGKNHRLCVLLIKLGSFRYTFTANEAERAKFSDEEINKGPRFF